MRMRSSCPQITIKSTEDPNILALQGMICGVEADLDCLEKELAKKADLCEVALVKEKMTCLADRCALETLQAHFKDLKEGVKTLAHGTNKAVEALGHRLDCVDKHLHQQGAVLVAYIGRLELQLQAFFTWTIDRITVLVERNAEATCAAQADIVQANNAITTLAGLAAGQFSGAQVASALTAVLNVAQNYIDRNSVRSIRNIAFVGVAGFAWGSFAGFGWTGFVGIAAPLGFIPAFAW